MLRITYHLLTRASFVILTILINTESRTPDKQARCKDIDKALKYLHWSLPDQIDFDSRCRRYAILLSMAEMQGMPRRLAVTQLATLHSHIIDTLHRRIDAAHERSLFLDAIKRYIILRLELPFVDLVACLRHIDAGLKGTQLDEELDVILSLYKKVLEYDASSIDIDSMDLSRFHPDFKPTLRKLLDRHIYSNRATNPPEVEQALQEQEAERKRYLKKLNLKRYRQKRSSRKSTQNVMSKVRAFCNSHNLASRFDCAGARQTHQEPDPPQSAGLPLDPSNSLSNNYLNIEQHLTMPRMHSSSDPLPVHQEFPQPSVMDGPNLPSSNFYFNDNDALNDPIWAYPVDIFSDQRDRTYNYVTDDGAQGSSNNEFDDPFNTIGLFDVGARSGPDDIGNHLNETDSVVRAFSSDPL